MYLIVRADLPSGVVVAQVAHAAGQGSDRHPPGVYVVVLEVPDEPALAEIHEKLDSAGVAHTPIVEVDAPWSGQLMAIGCEMSRDRGPCRRVLSNLPLCGRGMPT